MPVDVQLQGVEATIARLYGAGDAIADAMAGSLTSVAFDTRDETNKAMQAIFQGGATPFTLRGLRVEKATRLNLTSRVFLSAEKPLKGTPWTDALAHEFTGGRRKMRRFENALRRVGLPDGWIAVPGRACPLDGFGNIKAAFLVQLLSYLRAFGESGYKANMTDKRRAKLAARTGSTINGVEYFVSRGKGQWFGGHSWKHGKVQHLPPGIWSRTGPYGADIKPIIMFVKSGQYRPRVDLEDIGQKVANAKFQRIFDGLLAKALKRAG